MQQAPENAAARLRASKELIFKKWMEKVYVKIPEACEHSAVALKDSLPSFIDELIAFLSPQDPAKVEDAQSEIEYSILRKVIVDHLDGTGSTTFVERDIIAQAFQDAVGQAVSEYSKYHIDLEKAQRAKSEEVEAKLHTMNEELIQFGYIVSHDLREPLRTLTTYISLIEKKCLSLLDPETKGLFTYAIEASKKMQLRIDALRSYSQLDKGLDFSAVDLSGCFRSVLDDLQFLVKENDAQITCDRLPSVRGIRVQLEDLLQNLIENSIKFRAKENPKIHISVTQKDREWIFAVKDNGLGFDPVHRDRVFRVFQRLNSSDQYRGSGIGLSICRKIVERHGGRIWAESAPGFGSTFLFTLPMDEAPTAQA
jgi:light-regulated signal transduction histidine kinase (bacteriophytochrome)